MVKIVAYCGNNGLIGRKKGEGVLHIEKIIVQYRICMKNRKI